ncbi:MAG: M20 family peptidase, partial [Parvibaculum sp.]
MSDVATLKREVCNTIDAMSAELLAVSHEIHSKPELAFKEFEAARILTGALEKADLPVNRHAFGLDTAYVSSFGERGPEVAILSEYDALPGIGHACGHN